MQFSQHDLAIIHDVALGILPHDDGRIWEIFDRSDVDREDVYKLMLSDGSLSPIRKSELEREIIWEYLDSWGFEWMWNFDHGRLRHRFIAEGMGERGNKEGWFLIPASSIIKVFHFLSDDFSPSGNEPAAEAVFLYLVKHFDYSQDVAPGMVEFINAGLFDDLDTSSKEELLRFILNGYHPHGSAPSVDAVVYTWIKRGLLSGFPGEAIRRLKLKEWVCERSDMADYMEAGFWDVLSTHEKASMIAPYLDRAEAAISHLSDLGDLKTLYRLLCLEKDSPLRSEAMDELRRLSAVYSKYDPSSWLR